MVVEVAPYWNVNKGELKSIVFANGVEVAPYWNVNKFLVAELTASNS